MSYDVEEDEEDESEACRYTWCMGAIDWDLNGKDGGEYAMGQVDVDFTWV